jgi:sulfur carrier protein
MIKVNNTEHPFKPGMTIRSIMEEKNYNFPTLVVKINGRVIEDADFDVAEVNDGDDVMVMHIFGGG